MKKLLTNKLTLFLLVLFCTVSIQAQNNGCALNGFYSFGPEILGNNLADGFTFDCTQPLSIQWCYVIDDYSAADPVWLHGLYPNPDPNWQLTGLGFNSSSVNIGQWIFEDPQGITGTGGYFFDDDFNFFSADNFGDPDSPIPGMFWEACFQYDYIGGCPNTFPNVDFFSLIMNASGDNITGAFGFDPTICPPCPPPDDPFAFCPGSQGNGFTIQFAAPGLMADAANILCSCDNPNNIDLDGDGVYDLFYEEVFINTNPITPGIFDWNTNITGTVLDASGNPSSPIITDNGGIYTTSFYTTTGTTYNAFFESPGFGLVTNQIVGGGCGPCDVSINPSIVCDCLNPQNVDLDNNGAFDIFYEEITFFTDPATPGITDWAFGPNTVGGPFLDAFGNSIASPIGLIDNGDGSYTFGFYLLPNTPYQVEFTSTNAGFGTVLPFSGGNCQPCLDTDIFGIPCQCSSPFNLDADGDNLAEFIFQEVTVGIDPPIPGINDWTVGIGAGFQIYDQNANPILPGDPVFYIDNGDGTYTFQFWTQSQFPYEVYFESQGFFGGFQTDFISGFSCGPCPIVDPCSCDNPNNVDLDGDGAFDLFYEVITYETNPAQTGINDWVFGNDTIGPFFDAMGNMVTAPVSTIDNGDGSYSFVVYLGSGQPYQANFTSASTSIVTGTVAGGNCEPCPQIPTLSEWGLITLALLLMTWGSIKIAISQVALSGLGSRNIPLPTGSNFTLPFQKAILRKTSYFTILSALIGFVVCFAIYGEVYYSDLIGVAIAGPIFAYLIHLLYVLEKKQSV